MHRVSRAPHYLGYPRFDSALRTRLSRSLADFSKSFTKLQDKSTLWGPLPRTDESSRFGLFRFRSPLLYGITLFSFPGVTEMFHFTPCRSPDYEFIRHVPLTFWVSHSEISGQSLLAAPVAYRSLLRPSSPIDAKAFTCLPLVA